MPLTSKHFLGAHTIDNGGIHMAVRRADKAGMTAMQLFTAIPKYYGDKVSIRPERAERFREAIGKSNIRPENIVVHAPYVLSVANSDPEKWGRASGGLTKELERSSTIGAGSICFHPGSAGSGGDRSAAAKRIADAILAAMKAVNSSTRVLIENTAGAGATMGKTALEIGEILSHIPAGLRARTGYGLDTCHLYSSGYDIKASRKKLSEILDEFERDAGEPPSFFHLNDSEFPLGSNKDRHVLIGLGEIGAEPFLWLMKEPRSKGVPLILETPQQNFEIADDDDSPDPYDVAMMELLRA